MLTAIDTLRKISVLFVLGIGVLMTGCAVDDASQSTGLSTQVQAGELSGSTRAEMLAANMKAHALGVGELVGPFRIQPQHSGKCLDVTGGPGTIANGARIQQWECIKPTPRNQAWWFFASGEPDGSWYIIPLTVLSDPNVDRALCLDVRDFSTSNGAIVQQWDCLDGANQRWVQMPNFEYRNVNSQKALDVTGGEAAKGNGVPIQQWQFMNTFNQKWVLNPLL